MSNGELPPARSRASLALVCLTAFLLLLPLTLTKPGIPLVMKADEAAYYLAALSLWHDGDLVCDDQDVRRLFREFSGSDSLNLMSKRKGQPVYFSVPIAYPLVATPLVALMGANGMVFLNAALLMAMVWMGYDYLRRHNGESVSLLFSAGYFLLSTAFVYVFWLQAEVFYMACVMAAFYLVERTADGPERSEQSGRNVRVELPIAAAAALLAIAAYGRPMLAALALPILYRVYRAQSWRGLATLAASGVLATVVLAGTAYALSDQVWPYFARRVGVGLSSPVEYIERRVAPRLERESFVAPIRQVSRAGKEARVTMVTTLGQTIPEFLIGRHGGFLVYMPFAVLAISLFLLRDRRSVFRWLVLVSAALTAILFMIMVRGHWLGGGGFVGNRYFTAVYPSLLFLVRRIRPPWLTALGFGAAGVFLGPLLITPLGALVAEPTLQAHVRNQPFPRLPLEWSMARTLSGYRNIAQSGASFHGRRDEIVARADEIWVRGAKRVEMSLLSARPEQSFVFDVRNLAPENRIEICVENDCRSLSFDEVPPDGTKERVVLQPSRPARSLPRTGRPEETYRYRMTVGSEWGEQPRWRASDEDHFYLGAALSYLGTKEEVARELRAVEWLRVEAPDSIPAGETASVPVAVRNTSEHDWPSTGPTRVRLGYHWLDDRGQTVVRGDQRTDLPNDLATGKELGFVASVSAPTDPGRYILALDLVRERVSWFSRRDETLAHRIEIEVVEPAPGSETSKPE